MTEEDAVRRLAALESRQTRIIAGGVIVALCFLALAGFEMLALRALQNPQMLRVRQLVVVDEHGTERVIIGAPLPDPMILGKRHRRDGPVSGMIIADSTGTERGGYVTSDQGGSLTVSGEARAMTGRAMLGVLVRALLRLSVAIGAVQHRCRTLPQCRATGGGEERKGTCKHDNSGTHGFMSVSDR